MKKLISLFTVISLIISTIPATVWAKPTVTTLRVGLYYGSTSKTACVITSDTGFTVGAEADRSFTPYYNLADTTLTVTMSNDGIAWFGNQYFDCKNAKLTFMPQGTGNIAVDGKKYRGGIQFLNAGQGNMTVVNLVSADEYIYGVIGKEMSASWHIEALKAQAVCARNYALTSLNKHKSYNFDICTTTDCQVYGGMDAEYDSTIKAGMETAGKYLMYNGKLAETLFFASSGGHTGNAKYVWGNEIAYFPGVPDPYENPEESSRYNWSKIYTIDEIQHRLTSTGINIGSITDIKATAAPITGQVYELTITGTSGTHTYKNDKTRSWMGWDKLYSQRYTVSPVYDQMLQLPVMTSQGVQYTQGFAAVSGKSEYLYSNMPVTMQSSSSVATASQNIVAYRFDGHGWGHGVGMSQYGAKGMADQGFTYDKILTYYYPGTYLE